MDRKLSSLTDAELSAETIRHFSENACDFAERATPFPPELTEAVYLNVIGQGFLRPVYVLDIGCGTGRAYEPLTEIGCHYIGVDPAEGMIEIARRENPTGDFRIGSYTNLPEIVSEKCHGFIACASFNHVPRSEAENALGMLRQVLCEGAIGWITTPSNDEEQILTHAESELVAENDLLYMVGYSEDRLALYLAAAGFELLGMYEPDEWSRVFVVRAK